MTRKILSAILAVMLVLSLASFVVSADEELAYWVEAGATGKGTEDDPFGTIDEAIAALGGKDGTVYIYGSYNMTAFNAPKWEGMVTIKGVSEESIITLDDGKSAIFQGDTTIKDIGFAIGKNTHFNPQNAKLIMDAGEESNFSSFMHLSMYGSSVVEEGNFVLESGTVHTLYAAGGYCTSLANGVIGDSNITINGGRVSLISISADAFMDTQTGISIGGNLNIIINGGSIGKISVNRPKTVPEIMGALNIIFNNGMEIPEKFEYPEETVASGVFVILSGKGGMILPTAEPGVFEVKSDSSDKVAKIGGELVYNGTVTLEPGETEVEWVAGEQKAEEAEEKTEIKLTIGKAEIVTNGAAKALDVPAQIIDSRTMVPLRAIFEALGASVEWDDATKTVTSVKGETTVKLTIGQASINVNGEDKALDVPAQIVDSRTLVPVRAIAESFGCEVGWDDPTKTVTITK